MGCNRTSAPSDAQLATDVQSKIYSDSAIQSRQIGVQAAGGVVTLSGSVASQNERTAVASDAATIPGVKTVVNNLDVQQPQPASLPPVAAPSEKAERQVASKSGGAKAKRRSSGANTSDYPSGSTDADSSINGTQVTSAPPPNTTQQTSAVTQPSAPPQPAPPPQKVTIPAGTQVTVRLTNPLDSEKNQVGDTWHGTLGAPLMVSGETVIPIGADVVGRVADVKSAGRFAGNSLLTLELTSLSVNGKTYNIQSNQWSRAGKGEGKNTAIKAGGGAALGAIIGGLAGGGKGAAIGTVAGAGAGTGVAATKKGQQIKLGPEASLNFQLINSLTVTPQDSNERNAGRTPLS
jgi:hypothetical protein